MRTTGLAYVGKGRQPTHIILYMQINAVANENDWRESDYETTARQLQFNHKNTIQ